MELHCLLARREGFDRAVWKPYLDASTYEEELLKFLDQSEIESAARNCAPMSPSKIIKGNKGGGGGKKGAAPPPPSGKGAPPPGGTPGAGPPPQPGAKGAVGPPLPAGKGGAGGDESCFCASALSPQH